MERAGSVGLVERAQELAREACGEGRGPQVRRRVRARRLDAQRSASRRRLPSRAPHDHVDRPARDGGVRGAEGGLGREGVLDVLPDAGADVDPAADDVAQGERAGVAREDGARPFREGLRALPAHGRGRYRPHRGAGHSLLRHGEGEVGRGAIPDGRTESGQAPPPHRVLS